MTETVRKLPGEWHIRYEYSIGRTAASFLDALAEGKLLGVRCAGCERVFVPPKEFCEYCFKAAPHLVEVGDEGVVEAATVVTAPFAGSPQVPYCVAYVRLDGATSSIANFVRGIDLSVLAVNGLPEALALGSRLRVVFGEKPSGRLTDFWFEPALTPSV